MWNTRNYKKKKKHQEIDWNVERKLEEEENLQKLMARRMSNTIMKAVDILE